MCVYWLVPSTFSVNLVVFLARGVLLAQFTRRKAGPASTFQSMDNVPCYHVFEMEYQSRFGATRAAVSQLLC